MNDDIDMGQFVFNSIMDTLVWVVKGGAFAFGALTVARWLGVAP